MIVIADDDARGQQAYVDQAMSAHPTNTPQAFAVESVEAPDGPRQPPRAHARLETTINVLEGVVYLVMEDDDLILTPGDSVVIPAGVCYRRWNAGDDEARFIEAYHVAAQAE